MSVLFCVLAKGKEDVLGWKVAGLSLGRRLFYHAKRAGMRPVFIVAPERSSQLDLPKEAIVTQVGQLSCSGVEKIVAVSPGALPEIDCLKQIAQIEPAETEALDFEGVVLFEPGPECQPLSETIISKGYEALLELLKASRKLVKSRCTASSIYTIRRPEDIKDIEKRLFWGLVKDTEGFMSRHVERRISLFISRHLVDTPITPNQITIISVLIGLIGAYFISLGQGFWQVVGALLFLAHSIVDGCDGEIARIKFMESRIGGILDFWGDNVVHAAVFTAIGVEWSRRTGQTFPLWLSAAAVVGTFLSASIVYFSTMRKKKEGPLYTSVAGNGKQSKIVKVADFLSRRDFIYLVVILAFFRHLDWFLVAASVGSLVFAGVLIGIRLRN
ncbi:MAG: CDP-alcohol phosphatidyltransferase family protein [Thermodesulfobacteria bacterium]|nr:CDP-alcohol phosphatidyltransferase family protein [Thermodesulfobacteriota bacterium]